jgi:hypothetical protein
MKAILLLLFFFNTTVAFAQQDKIKANRSVKIVTCMPGFNYAYNNDKIRLLDKSAEARKSGNVLFEKRIDKKTESAINELLDTLAHAGNKLMYWNTCVDDGFCYVIFIRNGADLQKIFVSNYYEQTIDRLAVLFDKQCQGYRGYEGNEIGFGNDSEEIKAVTEAQLSCSANVDQEWRNTVFDNWQEPQ